MRVVSTIGRDKQLPGAAFPGLAVAQHHRVYAMSRAIDAKGRTAIQGEPGVGKTRIGIATVARLAYRWRQRNAAEFRNAPQPKWVKGLRRAWLTNPTTRALLRSRAGLRRAERAGHRLPAHTHEQGDGAGTYWVPRRCRCW